MNPNELNKNMGSMETSISDLQGDLDVANEPSRNHFKPGGLLLVVLVALIVGAGAFFAVTRFTKVDANSCALRNEQIEIVNEKFALLVVLFDASHRPPGQPPPTEGILKAYAEFRKPIKLLDCNNNKLLRGV